ncbi:right-handed parallel beta-helix repeat-containing protein [Kaistia nematophila]|uniref:Right-handed parallel beta-helix repeat-containing protein n=1 Tax=Kaistia nematophila TaxID=2994654 RepID=A0A9X3IML6_9HYPH|nr:right-handed parallel beta-helix repeat-containing protein [Kaistia nematophila]MCX5571683.1 right-handed parallel beta-helix repeat-containing protein [Kaistia nematophila]
MRSSAIAALLCAASTLAITASAKADAVGPTVEVTLGGGQENGAIGGFDIFLPFGFGDRSIGFGDIRGHMNNDQMDQLSAGLGWRMKLDGVWTVGAYGYYDYLRTDRKNEFHQISAGAELISRDMVFRLNGYLPFGDKYGSAADANAALIEAGRLVFRAGQEQAMRGIDGEAGFRLPMFDAKSSAQMMLYGGGYWYDGDRLDDITGVSARAELSFSDLPGFTQGSTFSLSAGFTYDNEDKAEGLFLARLRIPLGKAGPALADRDPLMQRVERANFIRTAVGATGDAEAAIYADTGNIVGNVRTVSAATGDAAAINAAITAAGENALILADGVIQLDQTLLLSSGQFIVGGQGGLEIIGARSGGKATFTRSGAETKLVGTSATADVLAMADESGAVGLSIRGGRDGILADGVETIFLRNLDIAETAGNGILLSEVDGALIEGSKIHDLTICTDNTECEFSIYDPERSVPNTAISLFSAKDVTIRDVEIRDVTYGIFANAAFDEIDDWENDIYGLRAPNPTTGLTIENVSITNTRREALQLVGASDIAIRNLSIDNTAMDRTMDLIVIMSSSGISMDGLTLAGGVNALQFIGPSSFADPASDITVSNVTIRDTSRAGIMMNMGSSNVAFSNIEITNAGTHGVYLYGPSFFGGALSDVSFTNVKVVSSTDEAVHLAGELSNLSGSIAVGQAPASCVADTGTWTSTTLSQNNGETFSVGGTVILPGTLPAGCR